MDQFLTSAERSAVQDLLRARKAAGLGIRLGSQAVFCWKKPKALPMADFPGTRKAAIKAASGRKRLNIHGAFDLETPRPTWLNGERVSAEMLLLWLERPDGRIKLDFRPPYAPNLNPIER